MRAPLVGLAILAALAAAVAVGCGTVGSVDEEVADLSRGKELFIQGADGKQSCGSCHTLADAGTRGTIGPNLDEAFAYARSDSGEHGFDESTIRDVVRGQIAYPVEDPPTGEPGMPADLVTGDDADSVAAYVASVAGLPVQGGGAAAGGAAADATDGKTIFTQTAGCGSCHTLAAAGTSGTVGPSLDEAKPNLELAIDRITNGKGAMPSFKDQLTKEQIQAVAKYVADNAGK